MSSADDASKYRRAAAVLATYPARPGWRKQPDGTVQWSGPAAPLPETSPPSRAVGIRYDERVRYGQFIGFETDDRGLLAVVDFGDALAPEIDTVSIDRVVGLAGKPIVRAEGLDRSVAALQARIAHLEHGTERVADALERGAHWNVAADLRDMLISTRRA